MRANRKNRLNIDIDDANAGKPSTPQQIGKSHDLSANSPLVLPARHSSQSSSLSGKVSMLFGVGSQPNAQPSSSSLPGRFPSEETPPPLPPRPRVSDQEHIRETQSGATDENDSDSEYYLANIEKARVNSLAEDLLPRMRRRLTTDPEELRKAIEASRLHLR